MKTEQPVLITSIAAGADLAYTKRFVSVAGVYSSISTAPLGVLNAVVDSGEMASLIVSGIALMEAGGSITAGVDVTAGTNGKVITNVDGKVAGIAIDTASTDGDIIRVKLT